jgi:ankyrin repeat protein
MCAAYKGHNGVVALLLDRGANIEAVDNVIG